MKKILIIFTNLFAIFAFGQQDNFQWAKRIGGVLPESGNSIATDLNGNIYVTGVFKDTVDFDPSNAIFNLVGSSGNKCGFILKLDNTGSFIWAKKFVGTGDTQPNLIQINNGNIYTTGSFSATTDFDPNANIFNLTGAGTFLTKLDADGNFIWAKKNITNSKSKFSFDASGAIYTIYSNLNKIDAQGNTVWSKNIVSGATNFDIDSQRNIYLTGTFSGTVDFDVSSGVFNMTGITLSGCVWGNDKNNFVSKLDSSGNFVWAKNLGLYCSNNINPIIKSYNTNVYNSINNGIITTITKLNNLGTVVWTKDFSHNPYYDGITDLKMDSQENVYVTGAYKNTVDFNPDTNTSFNLTSIGLKDVFILKMDNLGNFIWAKTMGGYSDDIATSLTIDNQGNIFTTGTFQGTSDFDAGTSIFYLTAEGGDDIFITKIGSPSSDISSNSKSRNIILFPNPTKGLINYISITPLKDVIITDILGNKMQNFKINNSHQIDISNFSDGIYFLSLNGSDHKILKID